VVVLTSVSTYVLFLPFCLPAFNVNGQTWVITAVGKFSSRCPETEFRLNIGNQLPGYTSLERGTALSYIGLLMNTWLNLRVLKKKKNTGTAPEAKRLVASERRQRTVELTL